MAIKIGNTAGDSDDFEPAPYGTHTAVCIDAVDLGMEPTKDKGLQHKGRLVFAIDAKRDDGEPFLLFRKYTLSNHEMSALMRDLGTWRGKPMTREEGAEFDIENLVGVPALINVMHNTVGEKTYANVASISPLPKGTPKPDVTTSYIRVKDRDGYQPPQNVPSSGEQAPPQQQQSEWEAFGNTPPPNNTDDIPF